MGFNKFKESLSCLIVDLVEDTKGDRKVITAALNAGMTYIQYNLLENGLSCFYTYDETNFANTVDVGELSDGSHTFNELYYHRMILFSVLAKQFKSSWRSKLHDDGTMFDGYFIVGINTPEGQFTYHYKLEYWNEFEGVTTLEYAPTWDGHSPDDITRLKSLGTSSVGSNEETVTITKAEYDNLVESDKQLSHLEDLGVDNWHSYSHWSNTEDEF